MLNSSTALHSRTLGARVSRHYCNTRNLIQSDSVSHACVNGTKQHVMVTATHVGCLVVLLVAAALAGGGWQEKE